ncbi:MAG: hypothetical protein IH789_13670 [Acidobacteria bacterium]|nr:hypothetical protein [Acidobacteriota bacterium]
MMEPSMTEIRHILEKLQGAQQPLDSVALFPDAKSGQEQAEAMQKILWLRDEGLVTFEAVERRGAHKIPYAAAGIKIARVGLEWLKRDTA